MKNKLLITACMLISVLTFSQEKEKVIQRLEQGVEISTQPDKFKYEKEILEGNSMEIIAPVKDVEKSLRSFLKDKYGIKFKKEKDFYAAEGALMSEVFQDTVDVVTFVEEFEDRSRVHVVLKHKGAVITALNNPEVDGNVQQAMMEFAKSFYFDYYDEIIEEETKVQKDLEKQYEGKVSAGENMRKEINSREDKIASARNTIIKLDTDISEAEADTKKYELDMQSYEREKNRLQRELEQNRGELDTKRAEASSLLSKGAEADKDYQKANKKIDKLLGEKSKLEKAIESQDKKFASSESKMNKASASIPNMANKKDKLSSSIAENEGMISELQIKIESNAKEQETAKEILDAQRNRVNRLNTAFLNLKSMP